VAKIRHKSEAVEGEFYISFVCRIEQKIRQIRGSLQGRLREDLEMFSRLYLVQDLGEYLRQFKHRI